MSYQDLSNLSPGYLFLTHDENIPNIHLRIDNEILPDVNVLDIGVKLKHFVKSYNKDDVHVVVMVLQLIHNKSAEYYYKGYLNACNADMRHIFDLLEKGDGILRLYNSENVITNSLKIGFNFNQQISQIMKRINTSMWTESQFNTLVSALKGKYSSAKELYLDSSN